MTPPVAMRGQHVRVALARHDRAENRHAGHAEVAGPSASVPFACAGYTPPRNPIAVPAAALVHSVCCRNVDWPWSLHTEDIETGNCGFDLLEFIAACGRAKLSRAIRTGGKGTEAAGNRIGRPILTGGSGSQYGCAGWWLQWRHS
jgi:hypothetical protein